MEPMKDTTTASKIALGRARSAIAGEVFGRIVLAPAQPVSSGSSGSVGGSLGQRGVAKARVRAAGERCVEHADGGRDATAGARTERSSSPAAHSFHYYTNGVAITISSNALFAIGASPAAVQARE